MKQFLLSILILTAYMANAQNYKVMTYNIRLDIAIDGDDRWDNRKEMLAGQVQFYEPDFLGVQEAMPQQMRYIDSILVDHSYIGVGRDDGKEKGEHSAIFYNDKKFKVLQQSTFWLSQTPATPSKGWDAAYNRVCTYGLFRDLKTKKSFWVFNLHLDHVGNEARVKGVQLVLSKITAINSKKYPVFLMGDFNSEPNTPQILEVKKVMEDTRDVSIEKPFGPSGTFNDFKHDKPVTLLIDYIFVSKNGGLKIRKHAVLSDSKDLKYPSDHLPVLIEID